MKSWIEEFNSDECLKGNESILLIIDDEIVLDFVHGMLNCLGYFVISFTNGIDAVESYRFIWKEVDLVVVDLAIPSCKGVETVDTLYTINPNGNVLLASGVIPEGKASEFTYIKRVFDRNIKCGKKDIQFIEKPYRLHELSEKISEMVLLGSHKIGQTEPICYRN